MYEDIILKVFIKVEIYIKEFKGKIYNFWFFGYFVRIFVRNMEYIYIFEGWKII